MLFRDSPYHNRTGTQKKHFKKTKERNRKRSQFSGLFSSCPEVFSISSVKPSFTEAGACPSSAPNKNPGKVSPGIFFLWRKGSLTLESALVLPLFLFCMISLISIMDLYRVETIHLSRLCAAAKTAATFTYNPAGEGVADITLPDVYVYRTIGGLFPSASIPCLNTVTVRSWNGRAHARGDGSAVSGRMVYVTESGTVFHRSLGCRYLNLSVTSIPASALSSRKNGYGVSYEPCERCASAGSPAPIVYITTKGNRYHNRSDCSALKRSVKIIRESDVGSMRACSNCGFM